MRSRVFTHIVQREIPGRRRHRAVPEDDDNDDDHEIASSVVVPAVVVADVDGDTWSYRPSLPSQARGRRSRQRFHPCRRCRRPLGTTRRRRRCRCGNKTSSTDPMLVSWPRGPRRRRRHAPKRRRRRRAGRRRRRRRNAQFRRRRHGDLPILAGSRACLGSTPTWPGHSQDLPMLHPRS